MNRVFIIVVIILGGYGHSYSQSLGLNARAGFNISELITENGILKDLTNPIVGFHVGIHGHKMFSEHLGVGLGLLFTQGGLSAETGENAGKRTPLNYLAVPVSARLKWGYFTLSPGVQPAVLVSAGTREVDVRDEFKSMDVMVFLTPGVEFSNGVTLHSTISMGLMDVYESDRGDRTSNIIFQFSVGYTFFRKGD